MLKKLFGHLETADVLVLGLIIVTGAEFILYALAELGIIR